MKEIKIDLVSSNTHRSEYWFDYTYHRISEWQGFDVEAVKNSLTIKLDHLTMKFISELEYNSFKRKGAKIDASYWIDDMFNNSFDEFFRDIIFRGVYEDTCYLERLERRWLE